MVSFRDFINAFRELGIHSKQPVIVHASLSTVGEIRGGAETVLGALLTMARGVMAPTFTYKTMLIPEVGPENNAMAYGTGRDTNLLAEFYHPDMPADPSMGWLSETIRRRPDAKRSIHPILSFAGIKVDRAIAAQTMEEPLAPIQVLAEEDGMVLMIGTDHTTNTSIHQAERAAGRKQFTRWALTPQGARQCDRFPGCSDGFEQAAPILGPITRTVKLGNATLRSLPLALMLEILTDLIRNQPLALLCNRHDERCEAVRQAAAQQMSEGK